MESCEVVSKKLLGGLACAQLRKPPEYILLLGGLQNSSIMSFGHLPYICVLFRPYNSKQWSYFVRDVLQRFRQMGDAVLWIQEKQSCYYLGTSF